MPSSIRSLSAFVTRSVALIAILTTAFSSWAVIAPHASATATPTIVSDLADYGPGATVKLTGAGWQPGENVAIVVNDTIGKTWKHTATVTAADTGAIADTFSLPNYFVSDYDVTAVGELSGTATTTFTDANPSANL